MDSLDKVLDRITKETSVAFSFDRARFELFKYDARNFDLPLTDFLAQICKQYRLNYFEDKNHVIVLFDLFEDPRDLSVLGRGEPKKTYFGKPEKFNFPFTGKAIDKQSGETLPFVNVQVKGTSFGAAANVDGFFNLSRVPTDTSTLIVSYMGYDTKYIHLTPTTVTTNVTIEMTLASVQLQDVVITGQKEQAAAFQSNEKISMVKMTPAKIATLPNIGERDIFRSFQLMPGVSAANENSAGLYVRGGTPDQALVLYDGFTVYHVDHLFGFYSAFNYNALKDVQLYKGGFESKFGGRLSSVAEITGKEGNQRQFNMGGDISLLSGNIYAEFPIDKKTTVLLAARKSYRGPLYNKIFDTFNQSSQPAPAPGPGGPGGRFNNTNFGQTATSFFYDLNSKVTYKPTDKDVVSLSFYNGTDKMDNSRNQSAPSFGGMGGRSFSANITDLTRWGNTGASMKWSRQWTGTFYGHTLLSYSNYFSHRDRSNQTSITTTSGEQSIKMGTLEDNNLDDVTLKSYYEWRPNEKNTTEFGVSTTFNSISYTYSQNDTSTIIDKLDRGITATMYAQNRFRMMNNKLLVIPGLRGNYYSPTGKFYTEPRLSANYQLTQNISVKAATGRYYQFAKRVIREDLLQGSRDFWALADGDRLPVSYANHFIFGASYETDLLLFDVEAYYKQLYGLSEYSLRFTPSFGQVRYNESFYQGTGETTGIDFLLQKKVGRYSGWVGYTLSQTLNTFPVYQEQPYLASQHVNHEFKTINFYKVGQWDFSLTWLFASGKPYTAPTGSYTVELVDGTTNTFNSVSAKNGLRLPDYHRMDIAVSYHWTNRNGATNSLGFSFFNVYNRKNVWYKEFQIASDQLIETDIHYLGFTPNVTLSLKLR